MSTRRSVWRHADAAAFDSLTSDWMIALAERGIAPRTIINYVGAIRDLRSWLVAHDLPLTPSEVSAASIDGWLSDPTVVRSTGATRARWTAARSFWNWVCELGVISANPMVAVEAPRPPRPEGAVVLLWPGLERD